jgi:AraC-like DNA-binding protein
MDSSHGGAVERALWFIESHFRRDLTLDQISEVACVSRYHMSRMFALSMGIPVMRYLRARRLSEAARALANGAPDILSVALDVGYGSHEAFTRALWEQFGDRPAPLCLVLNKHDYTFKMNDRAFFYVYRAFFGTNFAVRSFTVQICPWNRCGTCISNVG